MSQVRVISTLPRSRTLIFLNQSPDTFHEILDSAVKVPEQTKAVLDHLGRGKEFLQTIMKLGAIASEVRL